VECPANSVPVVVRQLVWKQPRMAGGKKHSPEQIVNALRQIEVAIASGNRRTNSIVLTVVSEIAELNNMQGSGRIV